MRNSWLCVVCLFVLGAVVGVCGGAGILALLLGLASLVVLRRHGTKVGDQRESQ